MTARNANPTWLCPKHRGDASEALAEVVRSEAQRGLRGEALAELSVEVANALVAGMAVIQVTGDLSASGNTQRASDETR